MRMKRFAQRGRDSYGRAGRRSGKPPVSRIIFSAMVPSQEFHGRVGRGHPSDPPHRVLDTSFAELNQVNSPYDDHPRGARSGTTAVPQERRRLANARPARPRPKIERLIGSGTDTEGAIEKVLVSVLSRDVPVAAVFVTITLVAAGLIGPLSEALPVTWSVSPFIRVEVFTGAIMEVIVWATVPPSIAPALVVTV